MLGCACKLLGCLGIAALATAATPAVSSDIDPKDLATSYNPASLGESGRTSRESQPRLAIIVPTYRGDLHLALASLRRWPTNCSPLTLENTELVVYYAEGAGDDGYVTSVVDMISESAGRCFAATRAIYADLEEEEDVYPRGPSVMFYKMFLDEDIRTDLEAYDALAVIEWDVLVASEHSFEQLYASAFREFPAFWVKGSHMGGTDFHASAGTRDMWNVLGHINGNAIYNNDDLDFVEYVRYTLARWGYDYPYDVALWLTVSDFPYSWPLWQRFSGKFVSTNLIRNVGRDHIDNEAVLEAIAGETLFIHGSRVDDGNVASMESASIGRRNLLAAYDTGKRGSRESRASRKLGKNWSGNNSRTSQSVPKKTAKQTEDWTQQSNAEMEAMCLSTCGYINDDATKGRCCDSSCESGLPYGTKGCNAGDGTYGSNCRSCFYSLALALEHDTPSNRAVMCDTLEPPQEYERRDLVVAEASTASSAADRLQARTDDKQGRRLGSRNGRAGGQKKSVTKNWRTDEDWESQKKWRQSLGAGSTSTCLSGCVYTSSSGKKGRCCDSSCETGDPYGTNGCAAKNGMYGSNCRTCYHDLATALDNDSKNNRAIMCDTLEPPSSYDRRVLTAADAGKMFRWSESSTRRKLGRLAASEFDAKSSASKWRTERNWERKKKRAQSSSVESSSNCSSGCTYTSSNSKKGRCCDSSCESGVPYGTEGCGAKNGAYGSSCRTCYNDLTTALERNSASKPVIMCDTLAPPPVYERRDLAVAGAVADVHVSRRPEALVRGHKKRKLGASNRNEESNKSGSQKAVSKWRTERKWQSEKKWTEESSSTSSGCLSGCVYTSSSGKKGRCCDSSCETGDPYGTNGCAAKNGMYGSNCRTCYHDLATALDNDSKDNRAIMCDTLVPPSVYDRRGLSATRDHAGGALQVIHDPEEHFDDDLLGWGNVGDDMAAYFAEQAALPYTGKLLRGNLCAFIAAREGEIAEWAVVLESILNFAPGIRVAIATEMDSVDEFRRATDPFPGVHVSPTLDASTAGVFADLFCPPDTKLIYYVQPRSVLSRAFTPKDTHSPLGDLLVAFSASRVCYRDTELADKISSMLGLDTPSFTCGTDVMLPVEVNARLRDLLVSHGFASLAQDSAQAGDGTLVGLGAHDEFEDVSAIPQMLAAVVYSDETPGVWFVNPQQWTVDHLFKPASIWDIPLMKPPFSCVMDTGHGDEDVPGTLRRSLDFFARGGSCESGVIDSQ